MPLTDKQQRFVEEYLVDLNATQAAIRAGYSAKTAGQQGERLLKNVEVQSAVSAAQQARSKRTNITADRVLQELAKIGFSDIRKAVQWGATVMVPVTPDDPQAVFVKTIDPMEDDEKLMAVKAHTPMALIPSDQIDDDTAAAISEVRQTPQGLAFKMHDKKGALVEIGRHLGMFKDKVEVTGRDGGPVEQIAATMTPEQAAELYASTLNRRS